MDLEAKAKQQADWELCKAALNHPCVKDACNQNCVENGRNLFRTDHPPTLPLHIAQDKSFFSQCLFAERVVSGKAGALQLLLLVYS